jgi:plastocyanin
MTSRGRPYLLIAVTASLAVLLGACGSGSQADTATGLQPSDRYLHVQATELDARRGTDQDPFPQTTLDQWPEYFGDDGSGGAGGYYLFMSDEEEWRIGSYMYLPQEITLIQGDRVTMEIFGVRGGQHGTTLVDPDGEQVEHVTVKRGELHQIEFTADKAGLYQLICADHPPTMSTNIHVLPAGV